eukprot:CAMPEP_0183342032 /NCGR_PEP_ID=MMETSP0164_2-20130417/8212_1 /TAXON_ID=221442 /ORGANISM="Coccolithus pelagicus ssp braarudi, Strain PLY182g" /LENGTH=88 /DNA_ID=CAMNT_0025512507 /DNA_START=53 /DNA_END=316 /DNA_ORIENTATION=+
MAVAAHETEAALRLGDTLLLERHGLRLGLGTHEPSELGADVALMVGASTPEGRSAETGGCWLTQMTCDCAHFRSGLDDVHGWQPLVGD